MADMAMTMLSNSTAAVAILSNSSTHSSSDAMVSDGSATMFGVTTAEALGMIGIVSSFGLVMSPLPTFRTIIQERSVKEYQILPYMLCLLQCMMWIAYGLISPNTFELLLCNGIAASIELFWVLLYFAFSPGWKKVKVMIQFSAVVCFVLGCVAIDRHFIANLLIAPLREGESLRSEFLGGIADVICILMYAAPLAVARKVIQTQSVEFMPLPLSVLGLFNSLVQFGYGKALDNPWIMAPNVGGIVLGTSQLMLYIYVTSCGRGLRKQQRILRVDSRGTDLNKLSLNSNLVMSQGSLESTNPGSPRSMTFSRQSTESVTMQEV